MSLFEALVALIILGLTATSALEAFGASARGSARAREWSQLVSVASSEMDAAVLGLPSRGASHPPQGVSLAIERRPWRDDLVQVTVTVTGPTRDTFVLNRLVRANDAGARP